MEANRRDWLENLKYAVRLDEQALWLLPARRDGNHWTLLIQGF